MCACHIFSIRGSSTRIEQLNLRKQSKGAQSRGQNQSRASHLTKKQSEKRTTTHGTRFQQQKLTGQEQSKWAEIYRHAAL